MIAVGLWILLGGSILGLVIPSFETGHVTDLSENCVNFQANVTGANPAPAWFAFSSNQGENFPFRTDDMAVVSGHINKTYCGFPLLPGHEYYYSLENGSGHGNEMSFTMPGITPHPTTSFGAPVESFLGSELNVTAMVSAIWAPYMAVSGVLGMGLVVGGVFSNMALKQQSVRIPAIVILLTGETFWTFMPPEFIAIAQVMIILSLAGMVFWFFQQRRG